MARINSKYTSIWPPLIDPRQTKSELRREGRDVPKPTGFCHRGGPAACGPQWHRKCWEWSWNSTKRTLVRSRACKTEVRNNYIATCLLNTDYKILNRTNSNLVCLFAAPNPLLHKNRASQRQQKPMAQMVRHCSLGLKNNKVNKYIQNHLKLLVINTFPILIYSKNFQLLLKAVGLTSPELRRRLLLLLMAQPKRSLLPPLPLLRLQQLA